jgi:hypothetical protein
MIRSVIGYHERQGYHMLTASSFTVWFWVMFVLGAYFLPTIIAGIRKVPNLGSVLVVNFFLGWTFIAWVVALAMAARSVPAQS